MRMNEGSFDRWLRVLVGLVLIALVFMGPKSPWGWVGLLPLITGVTGFCPVYAMFGWSTCPRSSQGAT